MTNQVGRYSFEQYQGLFNAAVDDYAAHPYYANIITKFGRPTFPDAAGMCAIIGIRHEGAEVGYRENQADDLIVLCRIATDGTTRMVKEYPGTTESGKFTQVINPKGDFKMLPGLAYFKHGLHKRKYPCLVQASGVRGQRGKKGQPFTGEHEIVDGSLHLHAGILNLNNVGSWSAGCQVIAGGWEGVAWCEFLAACKRSKQLLFPYILVDEVAVPGLIAA
jgi:hypothetical protein